MSEVIKARKPSFRAIAVEPAASPIITQFMHHEPLVPGPHKIQGIGAGFIPGNLHVNVVDEVVQVTNEDSIAMARRVMREEGLAIGLSSGAAVLRGHRRGQASRERGQS